MSKFRAYRVNRHEIYAGVDLEDAIQAAMRSWRRPREEVLDPKCGPDYEVPNWVSVGSKDDPEIRMTVSECLADVTEAGFIAYT